MLDALSFDLSRRMAYNRFVHVDTVKARPVPGEPGLVASEDGYLYANGEFINTNTYAQKPVYVHICTAWHGPRPSQAHMVCHRNDVSNDNRPDNLYWGTAKHNRIDANVNACDSGMKTRRSYNKLSPDEESEVVQMYGNGFRHSIGDVAKAFGISRNMATRIIKASK